MLNIKPKEVYEYIKNFNRNSSLLKRIIKHDEWSNTGRKCLDFYKAQTKIC